MCEVVNCARYHRLLLWMSALLSVCLLVFVAFLMMWEDSTISTRSQPSWGELWFASSQSQPRANLTSEHSHIILLVAQGHFWVWVSEAGWAPLIAARGILRIQLVSVAWHVQDNSIYSTSRHPGKSTSTTFFGGINNEPLWMRLTKLANIYWGLLGTSRYAMHCFI